MHLSQWMFVASLTLSLGCGSGAMRATPPPDTPLPPGEPTAAVTLAVDLPRAQDCEEAFDLSMYENRAVHLIEWDSNRGRCEARQVRVVYLPQRISKDNVLAEARKRTVKLAVTAER